MIRPRPIGHEELQDIVTLLNFLNEDFSQAAVHIDTLRIVDGNSYLIGSVVMEEGEWDFYPFDDLMGADR